MWVYFVLNNVTARLDHFNLPQLLKQFQNDNKHMILVVLKPAKPVDAQPLLLTSEQLNKLERQDLEKLFQQYGGSSLDDPAHPIETLFGYSGTKIDLSGLGLAKNEKYIVDQEGFINKINLLMKKLNNPKNGN